MANDILEYTYRAYRLYRDLTEKNNDSVSFRSGLKVQGKEVLEATFYECHIEQDWVNEIERCLPYLIDAIQENRQFVRTDGDTYPIEKIRQVSKDSIVDLSKHSNYITRKPDDGDPVIPDKLYQAQKDVDYSVYENRFLFTLLSNLHDFLAIRLNVILEAAGKYDGLISLRKTFKNANRDFSFKLDLTDHRLNDITARSYNSSSESINKLLDALSLTEMLLGTDLMKSVSHAPKVSLPIVETNVIKFDTNFKNCLEFFNFINAYEGDGYRIEKKTKRYSPIPLDIDDEFKELATLCDMLTYIHGVSMDKEIRKKYNDYLLEKKLEQEKKLIEETKKLAKKVRAGGLTYEQYALKLEEAMKLLEKQNAEKDAQLAYIAKRYQDEIAEIRKEEKHKLNLTIKKYEEKIDDANKDFNLKFEAQKNEFENRINDLTLEAEKRFQEEHDYQERRYNDYLAKEEERRRELESQLDEERNVLKQQDIELRQELNNEKNRLNEENMALLQEKNNAIAEKDLMLAELRSVRASQGLEDVYELTSKERFLQLEKEREAFEAFFQKTWKETKKRMKKEAFAEKPTRNNSRKKDQDINV